MPQHFIVSIFAVVLVAASPCATAAELPRAKIKRFVEQVTLGPEYGSNRKVVSRWTSPPTLSVFGATPAQKKLVEEIVATLNPALKPGGQEIQLLADAAPAATLKVYFAHLQEHSAIARKHNLTLPPANLGTFWMLWNGRNVVTRAVVCSDKLSDSRMRHFAFEEITQSLGLAQDSDEFPAVFSTAGAAMAVPP